MNAIYRSPLRALVIVLTISGLRPAYAGPILLAQYFQTPKSNISYDSSRPIEPITTVNLNAILRASSGGPLLGLYNDPTQAEDDPYPFGLPISINTIGTVGFTDDNAPGFSALTNRLAGSVDEFLEFDNFELQSNGDGTGGFGVGGPESQMFGGLLTGDSIDLISANIEAENLVRSSYSYTYAPQITWQIWGTGQPTPSAFWTSSPPIPSVTEPSSPMLFGIGMAALFLSRRNSFRKRQRFG